MSKPLEMFLKYIGGLILFIIGVLLILGLIDAFDSMPEPVYPIPSESELVEPWGFDIDE